MTDFILDIPLKSIEWDSYKKSLCSFGLNHIKSQRIYTYPFNISSPLINLVKRFS